MRLFWPQTPSALRYLNSPLVTRSRNNQIFSRQPWQCPYHLWTVRDTIWSTVHYKSEMDCFLLISQLLHILLLHFCVGEDSPEEQTVDSTACLLLGIMPSWFWGEGRGPGILSSVALWGAHAVNSQFLKPFEPLDQVDLKVKTVKMALLPSLASS